MKGSKALAGLVLLLASCADRGRPPPPVVVTAHPARAELLAPLRRSPPEVDLESPIVIVTLDGTRWQEVFEGTEPSRSQAPRIPAAKLMPHLHALGTERGAFIGAPGFGTIAASGPDFVSLPGYTEIFSGRAPLACANNYCDRTTAPTMLDDARAAGARVAAFTSWTKLDYALTTTPGSFTESCGPTNGPALPEVNVDLSRSDRDTANAALAYLEAEHPDILFLGLGEPDEEAHAGNYRGYLDALRHADAVLGRLRKILDRDERGRKTHIFVTADHGRAADFQNHGGFAPESARVWMVVSGPHVIEHGFVTSRTDRHLADLAPTARLLLGLGEARPGPETGHVLDELFVARQTYAGQ